MEMEPWLQTLLTILGTILASSGFWAYIQERGKRKAAENKHNNLETQMLIGLAHDRIIYLGMTYIERGYITQDEYENLYEYLYKPYEKLGGNGSAKRIMTEVDQLAIHKSTELGKKVDKVEGSRLMTNAEGTKLAGIAAGAQANVIEKIKVNGVEATPAAEDKSIALTIPTGKLAGKDIVAETDLDAALKEKVNAAAEGNHSHANKAFLDTLSGATDEEVTAMCTEVFGA